MSQRTRRDFPSWMALALASSSLGCERVAQIEAWLFQRHSPVVDRAIHAIESRDAGDAHQLLSEYLGTGRCKGGSLGTPDSVRALPNATLDQGIALFDLAERYGQRFGELPPTEEERATAGPQLAKRSQEVDCALRLVRIIAQDESLPVMSRAQAYYLSGNLDFLRHDYEAAVESYEAALELVPAGAADAGDGVGERAAYNLAIAKLRAEQQKKDPPPRPDGGTPPPSDGGAGAENPQNEDKEQQDGDEDPQNENEDPQNENEDPQNENEDPQNEDPQNGDQQDQQSERPQDSTPADTSAAPAASAPERPSLSRDEQILQMLERAPMIQQQLPKARGRVLGRSSMEDK